MSFTQKEFFNDLINAAAFYFFALALFLPSGYSWGFVFLLLLALIYFSFNIKDLSMQPRFINYTFLLFFISSLITFLYHENEAAIELDLAGRFVLAIPIVLLLSKKKLNLKLLVVGVALGGILAFVIAYYQVYIAQTHYRAQGHIPHIMFGQTGMIWGILSLVGFLLINKISPKRQWLFAILLLLGSVGGIYAALLSGSKGAWVLFPPAFIIFLVVSWKKLDFKHLLAIFFAYALVFTWVFCTDNIVKNRSIDAVNETQSVIDKTDSGVGSIGARVRLYTTGALLFIENPLIGVGRYNKNEFVKELNIADDYKKLVYGYGSLHNDYVHIGAYYGLVGLIPFLLLLGMPAWFFARKLFSDNEEIKYLAVAGFISVASVAMSGLTDAYFQSNTGPMVYSILVAIFGAQLWRELKLKNS